ncbi:hypothetical protein KP509_01G028400 [Ceratopteris richardii]|uniref:Transcription initiation factor IIE subunit beta n=1 Tax=Ceratopteris richardii TaxID=49495 RepID=A0A8T2VK25_CERRI|nr:hypothetical protein KP509_01G028400 [Ceratopteris richardii]
MALQEQLDRFKKQQARAQETLSKTAVRAAPSKIARPQTFSPQVAQRNEIPLSQRLSFSDDKEKLQQIANVRKAPVGAQIKRVIDVLFERRQALTPQEIEEICFVDVENNKDVFDSLKNNVKVHFDGQRFSYKSKHDLKNKQDLLVLIRKVPEGIPTGDLKDSYPAVLKDLQELKASGQVWLIMNNDSQQDIVYPNDPKIQIKVDDDVKQLIRNIETPREFVDVERELQKAGMKPATNTARRKAIASVQGFQPKKPKAKKQRNITKRTKLTNVHMPELFQNI